METFDIFFPEKNRIHEVIHPVTKEIIQQNNKNTIQKLHSLNESEYNLYFAVQGYKDKRLTSNLIELRSWFVDLDLEIPKDEFRPLLDKIIDNDKPSLIIETGKGFHIYWCLDEIIEKENNPDWDNQVKEFYKIENYIVDKKYNKKPYCSDIGAKDKARLMRMPNSLYYKNSTTSNFTTKIIYENQSATYSISEMKEHFDIQDELIIENTLQKTESNEFSKANTDDFSKKMNELYPIISRPSYIAMSEKQGVTEGMRNETLSVFAGISLYAGVPQDELLQKVINSGWCGLEKTEIKTVIYSAYKIGYNRFNHQWYRSLITHEEEEKVKEAISKVIKLRKEIDKVRYDLYEKELFKKYPNLKLSLESNSIYNYRDGYYYELNKEEISQIIFRSMEEDSLFGFRTNNLVANKEKALKSILPLFKETPHDGNEKINCVNGILDITTSVLAPHTPEYITLSQNNTPYISTATCPLWIEKLSEMVDGDEEKIKNIQMFGGYCLTKSTKFHKSLVLIGEGRNGKGVIMEVMKNIIGQRNTSSVSIKNINNRFTLSRFIGKQVNFFDETPSRQMIEADTLKSLIAGGRFDVEKKGIDSFEVDLYVKGIFLVNSFPKFDDMSDGTVNRLITVKFNNLYNDANEKTDFDLLPKLLLEREGIFNWFVQGAKELFNDRKKFITTTEQKEHIEEIKQDSNAIRRWVHEYVTIKSFTDEEITLEKTGKGIYPNIPVNELFDDFLDYANKYNKYAVNTLSSTFVRELNKIVKEKNGFSDVERTSGKNKTFYKGIVVNPVTESNFSRPIKSNYIKL